ncbi:hypothetical protein IAQ61_007466 [Plenodomus lingam]|uniref:Predicted protein n=1 Tax=Leptosphaeria maculans (strain JN3 / isolate v23.1.3 / race Av1-4-5-6-7-8) TaxID=985895 RepID=E5A5M7_LEPMJ|nr:predicted protein [Plenodomus lingam JN3]KAH9866877.1 hypothetical protein IAQ61_007466 [Plenodomus lingam]CBX98925.1 predicted protein [Plenodomus lingam JN3]
MKLSCIVAAALLAAQGETKAVMDCSNEGYALADDLHCENPDAWVFCCAHPFLNSGLPTPRVCQDPFFNSRPGGRTDGCNGDKGSIVCCDR